LFVVGIYTLDASEIWINSVDMVTIPLISRVLYREGFLPSTVFGYDYFLKRWPFGGK